MPTTTAPTREPAMRFGALPADHREGHLGLVLGLTVTVGMVLLALLLAFVLI